MALLSNWFGKSADAGLAAERKDVSAKAMNARLDRTQDASTATVAAKTQTVMGAIRNFSARARAALNDSVGAKLGLDMDVKDLAKSARKALNEKVGAKLGLDGDVMDLAKSAGSFLADDARKTMGHVKSAAQFVADDTAATKADIKAFGSKALEIGKFDVSGAALKMASSAAASVDDAANAALAQIGNAGRAAFSMAMLAAPAAALDAPVVSARMADDTLVSGAKTELAMAGSGNQTSYSIAMLAPSVRPDFSTPAAKIVAPARPDELPDAPSRPVLSAPQDIPPMIARPMAPSPVAGKILDYLNFDTASLFNTTPDLPLVLAPEAFEKKEMPAFSLIVKPTDAPASFDKNGGDRLPTASPQPKKIGERAPTALRVNYDKSQAIFTKLIARETNPQVKEILAVCKAAPDDDADTANRCLRANRAAEEIRAADPAFYAKLSAAPDFKLDRVRNIVATETLVISESDLLPTLDRSRDENGKLTMPVLEAPVEKLFPAAVTEANLAEFLASCTDGVRYSPEINKARWQRGDAKVTLPNGKFDKAGVAADRADAQALAGRYAALLAKDPAVLANFLKAVNATRERVLARGGTLPVNALSKLVLAIADVCLAAGGRMEGAKAANLVDTFSFLARFSPFITDARPASFSTETLEMEYVVSDPAVLSRLRAAAASTYDDWIYNVTVTSAAEDVKNLTDTPRHVRRQYQYVSTNLDRLAAAAAQRGEQYRIDCANAARDFAAGYRVVTVGKMPLDADTAAVYGLPWNPALEALQARKAGDAVLEANADSLAMLAAVEEARRIVKKEADVSVKEKLGDALQAAIILVRDDLLRYDAASAADRAAMLKSGDAHAATVETCLENVRKAPESQRPVKELLATGEKVVARWKAIKR